jgi:hypothetical protein
VNVRKLIEEIKKALFPKTIISGKHESEGIGVVTGIQSSRPIEMKRDTNVRASGVGKITATKID